MTVTTYNANDTLVLTSSATIMAEGNGGGAGHGATGGGGGACYCRSILDLPAGSYPIVIGQGGNNAIGTDTTLKDGSNNTLLLCPHGLTTKASGVGGAVGQIQVPGSAPSGNNQGAAGAITGTSAAGAGGTNPGDGGHVNAVGQNGQLIITNPAPPFTFIRGVNNQPLAMSIIPGSLDPVAMTAATEGTGTLYVTNRIPIRTVAANGDHLQFYEAREGINDYQSTTIFMQRSTNDGLTWGPPLLVFRRSDANITGGASGAWLNLGTVGVHTPTGRLHLCFSKSDGQYTPSQNQAVTTWYLGSDDNGNTWGGTITAGSPILPNATDHVVANGTPREITSSTVKFDNTHFCANGVVGDKTTQAQGPTISSTPGAAGYFPGGVFPTCYTGGAESTSAAWNQTQFGPGQMVCIQNVGSPNQQSYMVFGGYHRYTSAGHSWSNLFYSPDNGVTWNLGGGFSEAAANDDANESFVLEVGTAGALYLNCRIVNANNRGQCASITDVTANFSNRTTMTTGALNITTSDCAGCGVAIPNTNIVYVIAASDGTSSSSRSVLKIWQSPDAGASFPVNRILHYGYVGYSSAVYDPGDAIPDIHVSHEVTTNRTADGTSYQYITQSKFSTNLVYDTREATFAQFDYPFNEGTSGAISTIGTPILDHGRIDNGFLWDNRGQGGAAGTYVTSPAQGISCDGTGVGAIVQFAQTGVVGGAFDMGSANWTGELVNFAIPVTQSGGANVTILDNRNNTGQGYTLILNASNQLALTVSDGTHSGTTTGQTVVMNDGTLRNVMLTRNGTTISIYIATTAGFSGYGAADSTVTIASLGSIVGGQNTVLGSYANGTNGCAFTLGRCRVTHGIITTAFLTGAETKPTAAALLNNTSGSPPLSVTGCVTSLLVNYDGGKGGSDGGGGSGGSNVGGGWDYNSVPAVAGTALHTYRNRQKLSELWLTSSNGRYSVWDRDTYFGLHTRMSWIAGSSAAGYWTTSTSNGFTTKSLDFLQNTGQFSIFMQCEFLGDTGSIQALFDTCSATSSNAGITIARNDTSGTITLFLEKASAGNPLLSSTFSGPVLALNTHYFLGIAGRGTGVAADCYLGAYSSSGKIATISPVSSPQTIASLAGQPFNSTDTPTIGAANNNTLGCNWRVANFFIFNSASASPSTDAATVVGSNKWFNAWAQALGSATIGGGGLGMGLQLGTGRP